MTPSPKVCFKNKLEDKQDSFQARWFARKCCVGLQFAKDLVTKNGGRHANIPSRLNGICSKAQQGLLFLH